MTKPLSRISMIYRMLFIHALLFCGINSAQGSTGDRLRNAMIWHPNETARAVAFRKEFNLASQNKKASLCIFADSRYMLWINGKYAMRGPCRFDPKSPEYDSLDISKYLHTGTNTIAILVYGHISSGESMEHMPGLAVYLRAGGLQLMTDTSWLCSNHTRFGEPTVMWDGIRENINAGNEDGDWTTSSYDATAWPSAVIKDKNLWGEFHTRTTPLQVATEIPYHIINKKLPLAVNGPAEIHLELEKNIMGFCIFRFDADAGARLNIFGHHYIAKQGQQEYVTADVYGTGLTNIFATDLKDDPDSVYVPVHIDSGRIRFTDIKVFSFISPLVLVGSFQSSDSMLNRFWQVIANMHAQITQDTYSDGASEGNEWVADVHNISQFTNVAFASRNKNNSLAYGENKYLAKALYDFGTSQQPDGRIKAHHPSDRFDLHWFIEDFACIWMGDIKSYYEMTNDKKLVTTLWPAIKKQMNWFKDSINEKGLLYKREWGIFDNPFAYCFGEGATLNAYIYKAFKDAAFLASVCGDEKTAAAFLNSASTIQTSFNKYLWNEKEGTFCGMIDSATTTHAAVLALYTGVCNDQHKQSVAKWLFKRTQDSIIYPFLHLYWFKCLYDMNSDEADQQVLDIIHSKYGNRWNAYNKGYLTAEACNAGRNFHNFGMVPGYFLSAYILGVRVDGSISNKRILIEPRLGNLAYAKGIVATEHGPVHVSWQRTKNDSTFIFSYNIPRGITARTGIPKIGHPSTLIINGAVVMKNGKPLQKSITVTDRFIYLDNVAGGSYSGKLF